jgi:general secretion pathway protein K
MKRRPFARPRLVRGKLFASKQRGIALVMVMIAVSIALAITNQFGTSATIDMMAAANYRDQMRAHFLARTALNVSELIIRMQGKVESQFPGVKLTDYADQFMMAFCGDRNEISEALGVPVDRLKGLGGEIGNCGLTPTISTEDGKINLNCANDVASEANFTTLKDRLTGLFAFQAYDPVFDEEDAEGWRRTRDNQVAALMDYVDKDSIRLKDRGSSEDYGYESLKDAYKPKQTYLDSVGEIRLIRGVDDRFWSLFGKSFTVYGGCKVNLNATDDVAALASILRLSAENENDKQDQQKLFLLASVILKAREFGETFKDAAAFIKFAKDPASAFQLPSAPGQPSSPTSIPGVPAGMNIGIALKKTEVEKFADFKAQRTYRVTAWGEINRAQVDEKGNPIFPPVRRTITGVWDTKAKDQNSRKVAGDGAWVYLKEE